MMQLSAVFFRFSYFQISINWMLVFLDADTTFFLNLPASSFNLRKSFTPPYQISWWLLMRQLVTLPFRRGYQEGQKAIIAMQGQKGHSAVLICCQSQTNKTFVLYLFLVVAIQHKTDSSHPQIKFLIEQVHFWLQYSVHNIYSEMMRVLTKRKYSEFISVLKAPHGIQISEEPFWVHCHLIYSTHKKVEEYYAFSASISGKCFVTVTAICQHEALMLT